MHKAMQVPLAYTLLHVRVLIAWLFGGQCGIPAEEEKGEQAGEKKTRSHLFEIRKNMVMWSKSYRSGTITRSTVKILDPVSDESDADADSNTDEEEEKDELGEDGENEEEEPRWEAEEDFTPEHVSNSPDDDDDDEDDVTPRMKPVGIVYYHINSTKVHITLNTAPIQSRKGKGNTTTVFKARGPVYLNPVNITAITPLAFDDGSLAEDAFEGEDLTAGLVGSNWDGDTFEDYLSRIGVGVGMENPYALRDVGEASSTTSLLSTPSLGLDVSSSSSVGFRALATSSPPPSSILFPLAPPSSPPVMARSLSLHSFLASSSPASSPPFSPRREKENERFRRSRRRIQCPLCRRRHRR
ncbi:hypothetical protein PM082_007439 [Marasmius tenuissimus]|nr:hypothetical protein PM082_007439 [Marasmius tenuissimus]